MWRHRRVCCARTYEFSPSSNFTSVAEGELTAVRTHCGCPTPWSLELHHEHAGTRAQFQPALASCAHGSDQGRVSRGRGTAGRQANGYGQQGVPWRREQLTCTCTRFPGKVVAPPSSAAHTHTHTWRSCVARNHSSTGCCTALLPLTSSRPAHSPVPSLSLSRAHFRSCAQHPSAGVARRFRRLCAARRRRRLTTRPSRARPRPIRPRTQRTPLMTSTSLR